jgi:RNA polymerase sigma factor (sigma-70 family)
MTMSYRQALSQPMLSQAEELELVRRWRESADESARERLVVTHMRICYKVASNYANNEEHIRDLAQEGVEGLMRAVDKFDPTAGTRFATYARWWVKTHISQKVSKVATVVEIPPRVYLKARSAADDDLDTDWVSRQASRGEVALDAPVGEDGEMALIDLLPSHRLDPEEEAAASDMQQRCRRLIDEGLSAQPKADGSRPTMTENEIRVLRLRKLADAEMPVAAAAAAFKAIAPARCPLAIAAAVVRPPRADDGAAPGAGDVAAALAAAGAGRDVDLAELAALTAASPRLAGSACTLVDLACFFGMPRKNPWDEYTLAEIAVLLGVSRERVRQIEGAAFNKLKRFLKERNITGSAAL